MEQCRTWNMVSLLVIFRIKSKFRQEDSQLNIEIYHELLLLLALSPYTKVCTGFIYQLKAGNLAGVLQNVAHSHSQI